MRDGGTHRSPEMRHRSDLWWSLWKGSMKGTSTSRCAPSSSKERLWWSLNVLWQRWGTKRVWLLRSDRRRWLQRHGSGLMSMMMLVDLVMIRSWRGNMLAQSSTYGRSAPRSWTEVSRVTKWMQSGTQLAWIAALPDPQPGSPHSSSQRRWHGDHTTPPLLPLWRSIQLEGPRMFKPALCRPLRARPQLRLVPRCRMLLSYLRCWSSWWQSSTTSARSVVGFWFHLIFIFRQPITDWIIYFLHRSACTVSQVFRFLNDPGSSSVVRSAQLFQLAIFQAGWDQWRERCPRRCKKLAEACRIDQSRYSAVFDLSVILFYMKSSSGRGGGSSGSFTVDHRPFQGPARVELGDPLGPLVVPPIGVVS